MTVGQWDQALHLEPVVFEEAFHSLFFFFFLHIHPSAMLKIYCLNGCYRVMSRQPPLLKLLS